MRKLVIMILAIVLVFSLGAQIPPGQKLFKGKITLSFFCLAETRPTEGTNAWLYKTKEDMTNVHIDWTPVAVDNYEAKLSLAVASGSMPDILMVDNPDWWNKFGPAGAFVNIAKNLNEMPVFAALKKTNEAFVKRFTSGDGGLYVCPNISAGFGNRMGWMYREDIFAKHKLPAPKTYDEMYQVMKALKAIYPDSYPLVFRVAFNPAGTYSFDRINLIARQWNTAHLYYYDGSKWRFGPVEDNYRDMVAYLNQLYREKLMPQDWLTMQTTKWAELMTTDKSFLTLDFVARVDTFTNPMKKVNPDYKIKYLPPPAGGRNGVQKFEYLDLNWMSWAVGSTSKRVKDTLKYIDWHYTDQATVLNSWGTKGVTFSESGDGQKHYIGVPADKNQIIFWGLQTFGNVLRSDPLSVFADCSANMTEALNLAPRYDAMLPPSPLFSSAELEIYNTTGDAIRKYANQEVSKFIGGQREMSQWDRFVGELNAMGLQKVIDIHNAQQKRLDSIK